MISEKRPLCVQVPIDFDEYKHRDLQVALSETLDTEGFYDHSDREPERMYIVEACNAQWSKHELDEAGNIVTKTCGITNFTYEVTLFVKCMEPATWYLNVPHAYGSKSFCDFHRPRVRPL